MINKVFREQTNNGFIQFFRYCLAALGSSALDFAVLFALTEFAGVYYLASAVVAYLAGFFMNYAVCVHWVFGNHNKGRRLAEFGTISAVGAVGLALTAFFVWFFTERLGMHYMVSKLWAVTIVFFWNFFARRHIVFRRRDCPFCAPQSPDTQRGENCLR